jgi:hypothetical protein
VIPFEAGAFGVLANSAILALVINLSQHDRDYPSLLLLIFSTSRTTERFNLVLPICVNDLASANPSELARKSEM